MSQLKVNAIRHTSASSDAITLATDGTCTAKITNNLSNRRININGEMRISQRGTVTGLSSGYGGPDRFLFNGNYSAVTMSQSTDVPTGQGFAKSLKLDVTTAGGDSNADTYTEIDYYFESQDLTRLKYGSSSAETTTLSFWIKSPKTGIHWVRLYGDELSNTSGAAFISRKYTVSSANTWQKITLSFPGYTSDGFDNDNTRGMRISWYFAQGSDYSSGTAQADDGGWLDWGDSSDQVRNSVGQVNCFDSTSNDIYLTGVQFEVDSTGSGVATDFEHRSYGDELARCQRYCYEHLLGANQYASIMLGGYYNSSRIYGSIKFPVSMRTSPTMVCSDIADAFNCYRDGGVDSVNEFHIDSANNVGPNAAEILNDTDASGTAGHATIIRRGSNSTTTFRFEAEL